MCDSNCNCYLQYSTPPWWVTMGFASSVNFIPVVNHTEPIPTTVLPPSTVVPPPPGKVSTVRPGALPPGLNADELAKLKELQKLQEMQALAAAGSGQPALPLAPGAPAPQPAAGPPGGLFGKLL